MTDYTDVCPHIEDEMNRVSQLADLIKNIYDGKFQSGNGSQVFVDAAVKCIQEAEAKLEEARALCGYLADRYEETWCR